MHNLLLGLLGLLFTCFSPWTHSAVTATVDQNQITEFDVITLTIRITDRNGVTPDLTGIENDFTIISQQSQQNSSISIINGQQQRRGYVDHIVTLRPNRQGDLVIPSLPVGTERTQSINIRVTPQSKAVTNQMQQILFFETLVDRTELYVQSQLLYTVRLYYADSISGDFPAAPSLDNAVVEIIENEKRFETVVNNRRFYVLEKKYAIFPQKSGPLRLQPETFVGTRGRGGLFSARQRVNAVSKGHQLTVRPVPQSFEGRRWLPAQSLSIEATVNRPSAPIIVGDPINRVITLRATGTTSALLPELSFPDTELARLYVDQPASSEFSSSDGISAESILTVGIVPTAPGTLSLKPIDIYWWNTETDRQEVTQLPALTLAIGPGTIPAPRVVESSTSTPPAAVAEIESLKAQLIFAQWAAGSLLMVWLLTLAVGIRRQRGQRIKKALTTTPSQEFGVLKQSIKRGNPRAAFEAMQIWRRHYFPSAASMAAVIAAEPNLEAPYQALERALYAGSHSNGQESSWSGASLLAAIEQITAQQKQRPQKHSQSASVLSKHLNPGL